MGLLHEHERDVEQLRDATRLVRIAEIWRDEHDVVLVQLDDRAHVLDEQIARGELVTGDGEGR